MSDGNGTRTLLRQPAEVRYADELAFLSSSDKGPRPPGWRLSPAAVRRFILGSGGSFADSSTADKRSRRKGSGSADEVMPVTRKFHGDSAMVDRAIVTLMSNRGLMLIGEPGTAKSMLSELLAAAVSGCSTLTIQGTAGTSDDQIKYSWNYALLLAEGPTRRALVPAPLFDGLSTGRLVRFEEITRCPPEVQDTLISILSEKLMHIPEIEGEESLLFGKPGFNLIATANTRDRGVHEMSAALKRRFNFETVAPIADRRLELELVLQQCSELLTGVEVEPVVDADVLDVLVTTFVELRNGRTIDGVVVEKPSTTMSTAEAVAVAFAAGLDASYFDSGKIKGEHLARQLVGTVLKDSDEDAKKIRHYFDVVVKKRAIDNEHWRSFYEGRGSL